MSSLWQCDDALWLIDTSDNPEGQYQPSSDKKVLLNKLGITDPEEMDDVELILLEELQSNLLEAVEADQRIAVTDLKLHATLKRNFQLMPAVKWLTLLLAHIPDKYEHLVRYYGWYSNRARGQRNTAAQTGSDTTLALDESPPDRRSKANWARLIQKIYEVDPLECPQCSHTMRIISVIDDATVIHRILKHLRLWGPKPIGPDPLARDPPWPVGTTLPLTYHPVPDIA